MPLTVFDSKGMSAIRRERIDAAVEAAGQRLAQPFEAWIAADPSRGGVRVLITGPPGFERTVAVAATKRRRRSRSVGGDEPGLKRAAQRGSPKKSKSAVAPRTAAAKRPAAGRRRGGTAAAPAMPETPPVSAPDATAE